MAGRPANVPKPRIPTSLRKAPAAPQLTMAAGVVTMVPVAAILFLMVIKPT